VPTTKKSVFYGTIWSHCDNPSCPVREISVAVKEDRQPENSLRCPRCRTLLTFRKRVAV
jgi:hypothetical protein